MNWDEAPEGTTHWGMVSGRFYKIEGDQVRRFRTIPAGWEYTGYRTEAYDMNGMIPRPTPDKPWDGTGLPKVGTICEFEDDLYGDRETCEVIGYYQERHVWLRVLDGDHELFVSPPVDAVTFRPIKTPEQIAAEERETAIRLLGIDAGIGEHSAAKVYDAGWRKVE